MPEQQVIHRLNNINDSEHKLRANRAADCVAHVLSAFEDYYPDDDHPRKAIESVRAWASGKMKVAEAHKFALDAHAAARNATRTESKAAAR